MMLGHSEWQELGKNAGNTGVGAPPIATVRNPIVYDDEDLGGMQTTHATTSVGVGKPDLRASTPRPWTHRPTFAATIGVPCAVVTLMTALHNHVPLATSATVAALIPAVLVDIRHRRLPNRLVAAAGAVGIACVIATAAAGATRHLGVDAAGAFMGSVTMTAPILALHLLSPGAMGFGDVKAALVLGAALGLVAPTLALVALAVASATTAIVGLARRRSSLPFGPGLFGGALVALTLTATGNLDTFVAAPVFPAAQHTEESR